MVAALKEDLEKQEEHFLHVHKLETAFFWQLWRAYSIMNREEHHLPYVLNIGYLLVKNETLLLRH